MSCDIRLPIRVEPIDGGDAVFGVEAYYGHKSYAIEIVFSLIRFSLCLQFCIVYLHRFGLLKGQNDVV
jgi:hypothetical protein